MPLLSVILPTYNPDLIRLGQTLDCLKTQTLPTEFWELLIIDNNSDSPVAGQIDTGWHPAARVIREPRQGLTFARLKGFLEANGNVAILVDDDNLLNENYLKLSLEIFEDHPGLGAAGGKSLPLFEYEQPAWLKEFYGNLALRDLGEQVIINAWEATYPITAPVGAGMVIRMDALKSYIKKITSQKEPISDRTGNSLSSGGDNDIVLEILKSGWQTGYFPMLSLIHIIPQQRTKTEYLARLINHTNKSWIRLLESHQINPWKKVADWTVPLRKMKAWLTYSSWKGPVNYIRWRGACGTFDGLARSNYLKK
ncbi:glycosyltransferase [Mucilaginibacter corticis]|uniref:Glycosyltransferase n=1 Tax=Mucilaginibacter corticis TaxID=2597670 RepID=A0A556M7V8_9SPHI|nr:glycosyltransferase [Mucilaginibacter corticis]